MEGVEKRVNYSNPRKHRRDTSQKKATEMEPWEINWEALKVELTKEKQWTSKAWWKSIQNNLLISFSTGFFFSAFDLITDGTSGFTYIFGADYIKNVNDKNDSSVADSEGCKILGHFQAIDRDSKDYCQYQCFERDPIWGSLTLIFMFVPGLGVGDKSKFFDNDNFSIIFLKFLIR